MAEWVFWGSAALVAYAYAGYPLLLWLLARAGTRERDPRETARPQPGAWPGVTLIVPVHNEMATIGRKVENTLALDYPADRLEILFVSDGSTDGTGEALRARATGRVHLIELPERQGKAAALNAGLKRARHDILVFTDASIMLAPDAVRVLVSPFESSTVGCVSGEDHIEEAGGEGLYGRYELLLRRLESRLHSIVGASGSLYAQRRGLCTPFEPGLAPDFLSVLRTVERGFRAVSEPGARGAMSAVTAPTDEFRRKVRTILRGLTTLARFPHLLNPFRSGVFALELLSHKLARWMVPFFLCTLLASSAVLAPSSTFYAVALLAQLLFYASALAVFAGGRVAQSLPVRVSVYFTTVNLATLSAWMKYVAGVRQETWSPSRR